MAAPLTDQRALMPPVVRWWSERRGSRLAFMLLPEPGDLCVLLVRTDYLGDRAWRVAVDAATAVYEADDFERSGACLELVEAPGWRG
jgi:hypothetical protein